MNTQPKEPGQAINLPQSHGAPPLPRSEPHPSPSSSESRPRRWLLQIDQELRLIESEQQLATLLRLGRVTSATPVYEIAAIPRPLGDVAELARLLPEPLVSEPPIRVDHRSRERALLSEELAVLNRPLEDDVEYYDEVPVRRWPKRLAVTLVLAAAALGAYPLVASRLGVWRALATTRLSGLASPQERADSPLKLAGLKPAPAPTPAPVGKSEVKDVAAAASIMPPPASSRNSAATTSAGEVPARTSEAQKPEPDATGGAAVDDSIAAGRHKTGHRTKGRSSRNSAASRHD
jgi:hypothetical protein